MNKDTFVKIGVGVGLMVGLSASRGEVNAQEQNNDNPTEVPSIDITPAIEISSNGTETTRVIPVPTFEVPIGLATVVGDQMLETDELSIPATSFIEWINQANPEPETVTRFENILETFELLANDRLQDPTNPDLPVEGVDTFIEFNRGEDGITRGSIFARVIVDNLVSRDDGVTPIPFNSIYIPFITQDQTRQELGVIRDDDGRENRVTLNIDLMQNGEQLTGVVIKEIDDLPVSTLTERPDGTAQETGATEGAVTANLGIDFRNLNGDPIALLPFGTEMIVLPEARTIPGQENLGYFYEVLVNNQIGLVSTESLYTTQNYNTETLTGSMSNEVEIPSNEYSIQLPSGGVRTIRSASSSLNISGHDMEVFLADLDALKLRTDGNVIVEFRDFEAYTDQEQIQTWQNFKYFTEPERGLNGEVILPIYIRLNEQYAQSSGANADQCPAQIEVSDIFDAALYNDALTALYLFENPQFGNSMRNVGQVVFDATAEDQIVWNPRNCNEQITWNWQTTGIYFDYTV